MKSKKDFFDYCKQLNISTKTYDHEPLFTVEQADKIAVSIPGAHIKNLFLKDDKGKLWLLVADAHATIELKKLSQLLKAPNLRFAKPDLLMEYLGVLPGSVTPFALINDMHHRVSVVLDHAILENEYINAHPLENTATTNMHIQDFKKFLDALGYTPVVVNFQ